MGAFSRFASAASFPTAAVRLATSFSQLTARDLTKRRNVSLPEHCRRRAGKRDRSPAIRGLDLRRFAAQKITAAVYGSASRPNCPGYQRPSGNRVNPGIYVLGGGDLF